MNIAAQLIIDFKLKPFQVDNTLALFDEGATVPFMLVTVKSVQGNSMKSRFGIFNISTSITRC